MKGKQFNRYVVGFCFNSGLSQIILIEKNKPEWQKGYLNGVGGKIEGKETPIKAMVREFEEETGISTSPTQWNQYFIIEGEDWIVYFFYRISGWVCLTDKTFPNKPGQEIVSIYNVRDLFQLKVIPNLRWLIPMCLDPGHSYGNSRAKNYKM